MIFEIDQYNAHAAFLWDDVSRYDFIIQSVRDLVNLSDSLNDGKPSVERLKIIAESDLLPSVRLNAFETLVNRYPIDDFIRQLLEKGMKSLNIDELIFCAGHSGRKGMERLLHIIKTEKLKHRQILSIIRYFQENSFSESTYLLMSVYSETEDLEIKFEILQSLISFGKLKELSMDDFLINLLRDECDASLKNKIIECLGECGTLSVVETLLTMQKSSLNLIRNNALKEAIKSIQSRNAKGESGMLAIEDDKTAEGKLSFPEDSGDTPDIKED
ncbi:MAG: hypothetical protein JW969_07655 [Spirochaetales bacterium]|nr:hypothetical protein [Spirochaetales bacterium]